MAFIDIQKIPDNKCYENKVKISKMFKEFLRDYETLGCKKCNIEGKIASIDNIPPPSLAIVAEVVV
jgi:hypothetical protein